MSDEFYTDEEIKPRHRSHSDNNWALGIALILLGGFFLLDTFNIIPNLDMRNWWAIFILIPGLNMFVNGLRAYREGGPVSERRSTVWGIILIAVAFTFFFNLGWTYMFPAILILGGLYLLLVR